MKPIRTIEGLGHTLIEGGPKYNWDAFLNNVHADLGRVHAALVGGRRREIFLGGNPVPTTSIWLYTLAC